MDMITKQNWLLKDVPVVAGGVAPAYYHNKSNVSSPVITISASGNAAISKDIYFQIFGHLIAHV